MLISMFVFLYDFFISFSFIEHLTVESVSCLRKHDLKYRIFSLKIPDVVDIRYDRPV